MTRKRWLSLLALLALALALHGRLLRGEALLGADLLRLGAPWRAEGPVWNPLAFDPLRALYPQALQFQRSGGASWDPQLFLGHTVGPVSFGSVAPYDEYPPLGLLVRGAPAWLGLGLFSLGHTFLAGALALLWLRWRGHGPRAALAGAIAWELSPLATVWLELPGFHTALAPWAVCACWSAEALGRAPGARRALLLAAALGGAILAGDPVQVLLLGLSLPAWALAAAPVGRRLSVCGWGLLALWLAGGLGAVRGLPLLLAWGEAHHTVPESFEQHLRATLHLGLRHLSLLVAPDLLGSPLRGFNWVGTRGQAYANYQEARLYVGLPALVAALAGVRRGRLTLAPLLLAAGGLALAFPTPLARLVAATPFGSTSPGRWLWWLHLAAPVLVAGGLSGPAPARARRLRRAGLAVGAGLALVTLLAAWAPLTRAALLPPGVDPLVARAAAREGSARLVPWAGLTRVADPWGRVAWLLSPTLGPLLLGGGALAAVALLGGGRARLGLALLGGLLAHDLLREGVVYNPSAPPAALFPATPALERTRTLQGEGRLLLGPGLREDLLRPLGLATVGGYWGLRPARLQALLGPYDPQARRQSFSPHVLSPAWRDALAVTAVVCAPGAAPPHAEQLLRAHAGPDLAVWQNPGALPRARVHAPRAVWVRPDRDGALALLREPWFDPRRHVVVEEPGPARDGQREGAPPVAARLVADRPEQVVLEVAAPEGGWLVLADGWSSGWSVSLRATGAAQATRAAPLPADVALRAVRLPEGFQGQVVWTFALPGRAPGRALSGLSLLLLLLLPGCGLAYRLRR